MKFNWDECEEVDQVHEALYGTTDFDEELFLQRYRSHNQEVLDYFANRVGDLLVLNFEHGDAFEKLCPFLGREMPVEPFSHFNMRTD